VPDANDFKGENRLSVNLSKGQRVSLSKAGGGTLTRVRMGLGWDAVKKIAGIRIVIRDHTNSTVLSEWKHISWCPSAEVAESIACIEELKHLVNLRCISGVLESDCLHAISNLQSTKTNR
jgi:hypothetical protein